MGFHTGKASVLERWPWLAGDEVEWGWPYEKRVVGIVRFEIGVVGRLGLPAAGGGWFSVALGSPVSRDELYPFTSASFPLRLAIRKPVPLGSALRVNLDAGFVLDLSSTRGNLQPMAFSDGYMLGAGFEWSPGSRHLITLAWNTKQLQYASDTFASCRWWIPWGANHALGLGLEREIANSPDRTHLSLVTLTWRLNADLSGGMGNSED
jgi:hypothetical protein